MSEKESTMNYLGITYSLKNQPLLDKNFIPFGVWAQAYLKDAAQPKGPGIAATPPFATGKKVSIILWPVIIGSLGESFFR